MEKLQALCEPIANYLRENANPYTYVVISDIEVKLLVTEMGIPLKTTNHED